MIFLEQAFNEELSPNMQQNNQNITTKEHHIQQKSDKWAQRQCSFTAWIGLDLIYNEELNTWKLHMKSNNIKETAEMVANKARIAMLL